MSLTDRAAGARAPTTGRIGKGGPAAGRDDLRMFLVAGEHSGDALGGKLMAALTAACEGRVHFLGVGGEAMERAGLASQFPLADVAVMGPRRILRAPAAHLCARLRAPSMRPSRPIPMRSSSSTAPSSRIRSPSASASAGRTSRSSTMSARACGRGGPGARAKMRAYVDHVLALLPFEPAAHERLGGPPCTYVGHPLIERLDWLRDSIRRPRARASASIPAALTARRAAGQPLVRGRHG